MTRVRVPLPLRRKVDGLGSVEVTCGTVGDCLRQLEDRFPGIVDTLRDESGELSSAVNLYVNGEDVRYLSGLATPLSDDAELTIVLAIAGGRGVLSSEFWVLEGEAPAEPPWES